jgi:hypothetical protein
VEGADSHILGISLASVDYKWIGKRDETNLGKNWELQEENCR